MIERKTPPTPAFLEHAHAIEALGVSLDAIPGVGMMGHIMCMAASPTVDEKAPIAMGLGIAAAAVAMATMVTYELRGGADEDRINEVARLAEEAFRSHVQWIVRRHASERIAP